MSWITLLAETEGRVIAAEADLESAHKYAEELTEAIHELDAENKGLKNALEFSQDEQRVCAGRFRKAREKNRLLMLKLGERSQGGI